MKFKNGDIILSTEWNNNRRNHQVARVDYINETDYEVYVLFDDSVEKYQTQDNWDINITDQLSKKLDEEEIYLFKLLYEV